MTEARRRIATHAARSDFAPTVHVLLGRLGYDLLAADEAHDPALRIAREERFGELPDESIPVIALAGRKRIDRSGDPRVVGTVKRPASLHALYRLLQIALEPRPRAVPRVEADLAAHAQSANGDQWELRVTSLSENGCLVTGSKLPPLGTALTMRVEMPWGERITVPADVAYERREEIGLVFHGNTLGNQRRLAKLVVRLLERQ
jgi:hypothetical protein